MAAFKVTYVDPGKKKEIGAHLCKNCKQCIAVRYGIGEYGYSQTKRKIIARGGKKESTIKRDAMGTNLKF